MSAHPPRSLFGRFRSLTRRDRAGPDPAPAPAHASPPPARGEDPDAGLEATPVWSMVANVVDERPYGPSGAERRQDLKVFAPGAKVYVVGGFAGLGYETVSVIGRGRKASRFVTANVRAEHLTNWRVELVYSPAVLRRIGEGGSQRWPFASPSRPLDPGGDEYRFELLDMATGFARRNLEQSAGPEHKPMPGSGE